MLSGFKIRFDRPKYEQTAEIQRCEDSWILEKSLFLLLTRRALGGKIVFFSAIFQDLFELEKIQRPH